MSDQQIGVVGAGTMGQGIAQVVAASGFNVRLYDVAEEQLGRAKANIDKGLGKLVTKEKISEADKSAALARLSTTTALNALSDCAIIIEAAPEQPELKERVVGMHFFNPVPVLKLVEVIRAEQTSDATVTEIETLAKALGKTAVLVGDAPGFAVNRLLVPMINEAAFIVQEGTATPEAVDSAMKLGAAHPMGPLALADLIGLDVCLAIMEVLQEGFGDPKYRPCPLLKRMVAAGYLGRKSGRGFYHYD